MDFSLFFSTIYSTFYVDWAEIRTNYSTSRTENLVLDRLLWRCYLYLDPYEKAWRRHTSTATAPPFQRLLRHSVEHKLTSLIFPCKIAQEASPAQL